MGQWIGLNLGNRYCGLFYGCREKLPFQFSGRRIKQVSRGKNHAPDIKSWETIAISGSWKTVLAMSKTSLVQVSFQPSIYELFLSKHLGNQLSIWGTVIMTTYLKRLLWGLPRQHRKSVISNQEASYGSVIIIQPYGYNILLTFLFYPPGRALEKILYRAFFLWSLILLGQFCLQFMNLWLIEKKILRQYGFYS